MNKLINKSKLYFSPIKVNLFLHIINKRTDGYHNLETIFALLGFGDAIEIKITANGIIRRIFGNESIPEKDDLLIKAAKLLQKVSATKLGVDIGIKKKIPTGGGLGGGSSNAATVLLALNDLWNLNFSNQYLQQLGVKLGADIPVFVLGKNAFATGIGDKLTVVELPKYYYLIICANQHNSTAKIFSNNRLTKSKKQGKIPSFLQAIELGNDCLSVVAPDYVSSVVNIDDNIDTNIEISKEPKITNVIQKSLVILNTIPNRLCNAKLSGTGSCVFTIFATKKLAEIAMINAKKHICKNTNIFIARGIG